MDSSNKSNGEKKHWLDYTKFGLEVLGFLVLCLYAAFTIKIFNASNKAADAAKRAADIADATLKASQRSFEMDERPYLVMFGTPEFQRPPAADGKTIRVNITFKNIGKTPAVRSSTLIHLIRFFPGKQDPAGFDKLFNFLEAAFADLRREASVPQRYASASRQDLAPNATFFSSVENTTAFSAKELAELTTGDMALYCIARTVYADAFKNDYETEACNIYWGTDYRIWHICDSHNIIK